MDAARALLFLCREPSAVNRDTLKTLEQLAVDPHPVVRWSVAHWLGLAREFDEAWAWSLAERTANVEPSAQVLEALLRSLAQLASRDPDRALALVRDLYDREWSGMKRESLLRALAQFLIEFWVRRGHVSGRELVDSWIGSIADSSQVAHTVFFALRDSVTHGSNDEQHTAVRERAIGVFADLGRAAALVFTDVDQRRRSGETLSEGDVEALQNTGRRWTRPQVSSISVRGRMPRSRAGTASGCHQRSANGSIEKQRRCSMFSPRSGFLQWRTTYWRRWQLLSTRIRVACCSASAVSRSRPVVGVPTGISR